VTGPEIVFSNRIPSNLEPNRLAMAVGRSRAAGRLLLDLTDTNPTRAGFAYPHDMLSALGRPTGLSYAPSPAGLESARTAVAAEFARRGRVVLPEHIVLTASTSEAYSLLFKVLCDPGDAVLVPRPSYPLVEHLTRLEGVVAHPYDLEYHDRWSVDVDSAADAARSAGARMKAMLAVSPNNPTGSFVKADESRALAAICLNSGAAYIVDEVFADYRLARAGSAVRGKEPGDLLGSADILTFSLGGLSKSVGLPQVKLGWIAVGGPPSIRREAIARLEVAADTYLSVSTPVQLAVAELLEGGTAVRAQIQARVERNYRALAWRGATTPACTVLHAEGGWYGIVRVPSIEQEEELALALLERDNVLVHPGYFFDFAHGSHLVVSLLPREADFDEAIARLFRHFDCSGAPQP
jgi:aspartate/methionine/tyrosine aminotransferase